MTRPSASAAGMFASFNGSRTLPATSDHGISVGSWNTKPMACVPCAPAAPRATSTVPNVWDANPASSRSAVDLPQPDGPSSETNSPRATSRSSGPSAATPLSYVLVTPRRRTARPVIPASATERIASSVMTASVLRPQIETDRLVDEAQRVGLAEIDVALDDAGAHHLVEEARHMRIRHGADAVPQRVAGIDDAVFLHLGDGIGEQIGRASCRE